MEEKKQTGNNAMWPELEVRLCKYILDQQAQGYGLSTVQVHLKVNDLARDGCQGFQRRPFMVFSLHEAKRNKLANTIHHVSAAACRLPGEGEHF